MNPRDHRGFGILLLLVLLLAGLAVVPTHALGQNQIVGLVSQCASSTYLSGATVTLTDANGVQNPQTTTTAGDGTFSFSPPAGYYTVTVTKTGYFASSPTTPIRFDGSVTVTQNVCLDPTPPMNTLLTVHVHKATDNATISGASVQVYYPARNQVVASNTTNATGSANLTVWSDTFELRAYATGFAANLSVVDTSAVTEVWVHMEANGGIQGHARNTAGQFVSAGLQAHLYSASAPLTSGVKIIRADVVGSLYTFHAPAGTYTMVVDANGYAAYVTTVTVTAGVTITRDATLPVSDRETFATTVLYGRQDWNNLTIYRNLTLNPDSTFAALNPAGLRDLRLQIDFTLGNGNGLLDGAEPAAFDAWLLNNGPVYTTTDGFLTTNGRSYNSSAASYFVTVEGLTTPGSKVWINTSATYTIKGTSYIAYGAQRYFVNATVRFDSNTSAYQDQAYTIALPRTYEMTSFTVTTPPVTVSGATRITLDPGIPSGTAPPQNTQVRMIVQRSLSGTANAKIVLPAGKFSVVNASFSNYQAFVAKDTNLTFSAEDSTDPVGDIAKANFTWRFLANDTVEGNLPANIGYGIRPYYTYRKVGEFVVNLTVTQAGGNKTYRDIKVWVDGEAPIARIKTNRTGSGSINGTELRVDEKSPIRFDASLSTDLAYLGKNGLVQDPSGYAWDFNGDRITDSTGKIVEHSFAKPGRFTVNLTVTDSVGWKSVNATITLVANDTTAPTVAFDIRDPRNDYAIVPTLTENREYSFNASRTTDNYDEPTALNYSWSIPGPILGRTGRGPHPFYGMNISFTWTEFNTSYNVILNVTDSGFDGRTGNKGNITRAVTVQVDWTVRPDLKIDSGTLEVTPTDPEDATTITVTVNVTNKEKRGTAGNVTAQLLSIAGGVTTVLSSTPEWRNKSGLKLDRTIASGESVTLTFAATVNGQGNRTIQVLVYDSREPYTAITPENRASTPVNVRQAAWVQYAIYGSIVGVLAVFVFYAYYRRKVRAGEWQPLRRRGEKRAEGAEKKARKEVKEEKKRL